MPSLKKAELIDGVVYMPSPVSTDQHGDPHTLLTYWCVHYRRFTLGVRSSADGTLRLDQRNVPQPDDMLFIVPECGGAVTLDDQGYIHGGPEFAAEISATTVSLDLNRKKDIYSRFRVQEYLVWRVLDQSIDWFGLHGRRFRRQRPDHAGVYRSRILPGLWLDPEALIEGHLDRVIAVLDQGLASPEHATFVEQLQARRTK